MFEFIDGIKQKVRQDRERRNLQKAKEAEFKVIEDKKKYETSKETLDRDIELEIRKAKIRRQQSILKPKQDEQKQKSAFGKFQDFATDFANNQSKTTSMIGDFNMGFDSSQEPKDKPRYKTKKRKKKRSR